MENSILHSLFDEQEREPLTVTELNNRIKGVLEREFANVWIEAEITDFSEAGSGHWYFTLQDGSSSIRAVCFKGTNWKIRFRPFDGLLVRVRGKVSAYPVRGEYQILVDSLQASGEGALKIAFEQIKAKLKAEGLFDAAHKRRLPFLPKRVGVVTSATGATIFDILNVISRRTRTVDVVLIPALVQGENAPKSIRDGILLANSFNETAKAEDRLDVLIVGRGGGSAEDLSAFNEERLARTIFESDIPVISAVGHEIDFSISDFVADMRAPTPSAAAELVSANESELIDRIDVLRDKVYQSLDRKISETQSKLERLSRSAVFQRFPERVSVLKERRAALHHAIEQAIKEKVAFPNMQLRELNRRLSPVKLASDLGKKKSKLVFLKEKNSAAIIEYASRLNKELKVKMAALHALSPLAVLERGYSITHGADGKILRDAAKTRIGEEILVKLSKGELKAEVKPHN